MCITVYVLYYALCNNFWVTIIQIIKFPKVWLAFTLVEILVRILEDPTSILTKILPQDLRILMDPDWDPQGSWLGSSRILSQDPWGSLTVSLSGSCWILKDSDGSWQHPWESCQDPLTGPSGSLFWSLQNRKSSPKATIMVKSVGMIPISPLPRISTQRPPTHTNIDSGGGGQHTVATHNVNDSLEIKQ